MYFTDEKDYIMRMIKEMVRVLFSLMFGKKYVSVELEKENKVFVIRPTIPEISRTEDDYNKKITYYNHGYSQMRTGFNDLQEYLNS